MNLHLLKRLIIAMAIFVSSSIPMAAQNISKWTVSYDNNFNAVVKITVKNTTKKTITAIKLHVSTKPKYLANSNYSADEFVTKKYTCTISPNGSSTFDIPVKLKDDYTVKGVMIDTVRFSDGTIR